MKTCLKAGVFVFLALLISYTPVPAAEEFPSKPITLMVPWPAGGSTDIGARIVASIAEKKAGQPVVVVNRAGAGSQVGLNELAHQKPDGYYIGFASLPAANTIILDPERKAAFTVDSFLPIINQVLDPGLIWVKADSPYKTLKDLLDDAKKRPGEIRAATTGIMGDDHLAILMLEEGTGVSFRIVHFDGGAPQFTGTLGGQVDVAFDNVGSVFTKVKAGQVRGLAVMDKERSKFLPDVPTTVELGFPKVISSSTRGIMGPAGIPAPIVEKIQKIFMDSMKDPGHIEKMDKVGLAVKPMVGKEYADYFRQLHQVATPLFEKARKAN
ncbi:MAG: tripartite tricarboxylate transporter substrate binding protein [Desulfobacteraceae bacterium]|nr:MAG: tripartite tricarboxylate transporter substrate binding protein [Desulfobacteraceae bacterium]